MENKSPSNPTAKSDLSLLQSAASEAGRIAMRYFDGPNRVWTKGKDSPVSEADIAVDRFLRTYLLEARPDSGWLSEETADTPERLRATSIFVVDPIDGTRGFVAGNPAWCISIAMVRDGIPMCGVLHCPALGRSYSAGHGLGAWLNGERLLSPQDDAVRRIAGSKRINEALQTAFPGRFEIPPFIPSLAYRIALVAGNELDGAFARGGAREWDVAAADLIVREAGGQLTTARGEALYFNAQNTRTPALIAAGAGRMDALMDIANSARFLH